MIKGFTVYERTAMMVINPAAVKNAQLTRDTVLEFELGYSPVIGGATAVAKYWRGSMTIEVEYRDPPGGVKAIRVGVGDFDGKDIVAADERADNLKEVRASYPEKWAEFCALLPETLLAAEVMGT